MGASSTSVTHKQFSELSIRTTRAQGTRDWYPVGARCAFHAFMMAAQFAVLAGHDGGGDGSLARPARRRQAMPRRVSRQPSAAMMTLAMATSRV
jgi:hypothetical protein